MSEVDDLIKDLKNDDKKVKQRAAERLGEIGETVEALRALQEASDDRDRGTKNKAKAAVLKVQERIDRKSSGGAWGSSSFSDDDSDERQLEITSATERKTESEDALRMMLVETQKGTINLDGSIYEPQEGDDSEERPTIDATGQFSIKNTGETDRIWDIDVSINEPGLTNLEKEYHVNELAPQEEWIQEYDIKDIQESLTIGFSEVIDTFPDTEESSNVLVYGQSMQTNLIYIMRGEKELLDINFSKELPVHFSDVSIQRVSLGDAAIEEGSLVWKIPKLGKGEEAELKVTCLITVEDIEIKRTGKAQISFYSDQEGAFSSLDVYGSDGLVRNYSYIEADEIEDRPDHWNCKLVFNNRSEFPVELRDVKISRGDEVYIMHEFRSGDVFVESNTTWESEVWTTVDEDLPRFEKNVYFTVKPEILYKASSEITVVDTEMRVANVKASKSYGIEEVDSYRETQIPTTIEVQNIGSLAFSTLTIKDHLPRKFLPADSDNISVKVGDEEITDYEVSYEPNDIEDADKEHEMIVKINREISPEEITSLKYSPTLKAEPDSEFTGVAEITAELAEPGPNLVREVEDWLTGATINVVHARKAITFGKTVNPGAEAGIYEIQIIYKNRGNKVLNDVKIRDIVPEGFSLLDDNMSDLADDESVPEGNKRTWTFDSVEIDQEIEINYRMQGESDEFEAGKAQTSIL
ncbi:MAG: hypothetical protein HeimC3_11060 [Candidatus Heimdallarchaeota archaeon LC_3]|nr:MAG: hypothetical protein HeimC3_11060 [Candidatus Heimdallarchaeota archaeon LC_3]